MKNCIVCRKKSKLKFLHKEFSIYQCENCSVIFVDPDQIDGKYYMQYVKDISSTLLYYKNIEEYDRRSFVKRLRFLDRYFPRKGSLLEIGSSIGTFLQTAKDYGWKVTGIEPNKKICEQFTKKNKNIKVFNTFFDNSFIKFYPKKYDLVYSSDVIEHTPDPVSFLENSRKLLKKDGLIVVVTPDFDSFLTKLFQIKPTEHLIYLNEDNIRQLYKEAGLKILEVVKIHRYRNIKGMLHSTTFTDKNNFGAMMIVVKLINALGLNFLIEFFLDLFKEDLLIVAKM